MIPMQNKILNRLKETDGYLSGAQLGDELGVSRAAIWKGIKRLRQQGYEIEAVNNRGYRLVVGQELYNQAEITAGIATKRLGRTVFFYDATDSTNLCIRRLAQENQPEGTLAVTELQTAGRGRMGRRWTSAKGTGIWMSLLLRPKMQPKDAPVLTLLAGMAVCRAIRKQTGLMAVIKWPNDILLNGKKVCGILTEMDGEMECVRNIVVGIGVNVNTTDFPADLGGVATSLKRETKANQDIPRIPLLARILLEFEEIYERFQRQWDFMEFLPEYKALCDTLQKDVQVLGRNPFCGRAVDITPHGELLVRNEHGEDVVVYSGEVSVRAVD